MGQKKLNYRLLDELVAVVDACLDALVPVLPSLVKQLGAVRFVTTVIALHAGWRLHIALRTVEVILIGTVLGKALGFSGGFEEFALGLTLSSLGSLGFLNGFLVLLGLRRSSTLVLVFLDVLVLATRLAQLDALVRVFGLLSRCGRSRLATLLCTLLPSCGQNLVL